ncbi:PucR family transcriptional regulator [Glutamicibacter halophytocola]|uniref:PucR family transcriptional regulator n=1 Tax=Glutamicibacter halophytocola TaxID=1933880 RepID=A0AA94XQX8_9MICC|nr:PucR family transcriptional regulator [Glutamicibacter halophytocola]UUX58230.1 PucR family transcriptional regulator [Glutamicibacter halophytocola]
MLTVNEVLQLPVVQAADPRILCADGLDSELRWVHVTESSENTELLLGRELVLTTLRNVSDVRGFITALRAAGAAAVIIEDTTGSDISAADLGLPVIVLRRRTRFVAITEVIHQLLVAQQLEAVQFSRTVHEIYTGLSLSEADEADIVARTAELLCAPVVLEDVRHRVLAHADAHLEDWINRSKFVGYLQHTGRATGAENWLQTPVGAARRRWGRLIVPAQLQDDDRAALVLERAGQALTIARLSGRDERELLYQTRTATLHELAAGHSYSEKELSIRTQALGLAAAAYYVPVVISTSAAASATETQLADRALLEELDQLADSMHLGILAGLRKPGYLSILLPVRARELIDSTLQGFTRRLAEQRAEPVAIGVGPEGTLGAAITGLEQAAQVAEIVPHLPTRAQPYYRFADLRLRGVLSAMGSDPRMRTFAHAELASLLNPVDEPALDLLELYLAHSGNKSALAKAGYLSRPTLYSRLAKLEAKLGVVLDSAESRASLQVALLWYRMHG